MPTTISNQELHDQRLFMQKVCAATHIFPQKPLAYLHSYGCRQNVSDGEKLRGMLAEMGYGFTEKTENADFILFNTCAVRENAETRVFGNVGALKILKKRNPRLIIAVCGCMVQQKASAERLRSRYPFVDLIFGTHVLHKFPQLMFEKMMYGGRLLEIPESDGVIAEGLPVLRENKIKVDIPIMYGCNNFCTYCVVPLVRGRERSRSADDIAAEFSDLVAHGARELTLLGQNVNSYGKGGDVDFPQLLRRLNDIDGDFKISFMTSHPRDCTERLIDTIAACRKVSRHLHLPVQSGSNRILTLMNRHYTRERYLQLVDYAREKIPDLTLTTDIIVGFPGETYEDFLETLSLMEQVRFDSAFTFIYSPRGGTKAAEMQDNVTPEEKSRWFRQLLDAQDRLGSGSYDKYVGQTLRVLCDGRGRTADEYYTGRSWQNIIVDFNGNDSLIGKFVDVKITSALSWALIGELSEESVN